MQIQNHFDIPIPPAAAWPILMNVPDTAACFPGVGSIEQISEDHYKGRVTVKLGPLTMLFAGNLHIETATTPHTAPSSKPSGRKPRAAAMPTPLRASR